jgi:hypothetical protein
MSRPVTGDYPLPFEKYISLVKEESIVEALKNQYQPALNLLQSITEQKSTYAYAPDKWSIKELMQHIIDTERIFNYRALCIARGEQQSLPGFDENEYAANSNAGARKWDDLLNEFVSLRNCSKILYKSFTEDMLNSRGLSNGAPATVRSFGFIVVGHLQHHLNILQERYL